MLASAGCTALAVDDYSEVSVVTDKAEVSCDFPYFSLLNVTGVCRGVSIKNALYPLDRAELTTEFPLGISNEPLPGKTARIFVGEGRALLIKVRRN
jgi:thiamine pyrophosphokinase